MLLWQRHWHIPQMLQMFIHLSSVAGSWPNLVFFGHCSTWVWQSTMYPWNAFFLLPLGVMTTECCQETCEMSLVSVVHRIYKTFVHQTEEMWAAPPPAPVTTVWSRGTQDTAWSSWVEPTGPPSDLWSDRLSKGQEVRNCRLMRESSVVISFLHEPAP